VITQIATATIGTEEAIALAKTACNEGYLLSNL